MLVVVLGGSGVGRGTNIDPLIEGNNQRKNATFSEIIKKLSAILFLK